MIAIKSYLKLVHYRASLKILNNLSARKAAMAVKVPPDIFLSNWSMIYSVKDMTTMKQSNIFKESLK